MSNIPKSAMPPNRRHHPILTTIVRRGFAWYTGRYLKRHFHAVRIAKGTEQFLINSAGPLIVLINHPAWWDVLIGALIQDQFWPDRDPRAPIDAEALGKYPLFRRLGLFGVDLTSAAGVRQFLGETVSFLKVPDAVLWITPQGRFTDVRERVPLRPGVAHLISGMSCGVVIPLAIEYAFWEERTLEVLIEVGPPLLINPVNDFNQPDDVDHPRAVRKAAWQTRLEQALAEAQDRLAAKVVARDPTAFLTLVSGQFGIGGVYDLFRRMTATTAGRRFDARHSQHGDSS